MLALCAGLVFGQQAAKQYTVDDVWATLNEYFSKYPWANPSIADKRPTVEAPTITIARFGYPLGMDSMGDALNGEILHIKIIKGGYRYTMRYDFTPIRERGSIRSEDLKNSTYGLLAGLSSRMGGDAKKTPAAAAAPAADAAPAAQ